MKLSIPKSVPIFLLFFLRGIVCLFPYTPINPDSSLYARDIPVFAGNDLTKKRIERLSEDHTVWALNLSGGSARAFAHIGVIKRLEEEGLRPDVIITNSMGSIVGLAYAAGMRISDIEDLIKTISISEFFDLSFPSKGGIIDVRRFKAFVNYLFKDTDINDTPIPVYVVTEDLISKRQIVLSKGNLAEIMTASFALPVYFDPVNFEGFRLIDGGTSNLVPIAPFNSFLPNMVVSSTFYDAKVNLENPVTILNVTMDISKTRRAVSQIKKYKPFLIRCSVEDISYMAFDDGENIIRKGYESCGRDMPELVSYLADRGIHPNPSGIKDFDVSKEIHDRWIRIRDRIDYITLPYDGKGRSSAAGLNIRKTYGGEHYLKQDTGVILNNLFWNDSVLFQAGITSDFDGIPGIRGGLDIGIADSFFITLESSVSFPDLYGGTPDPGEEYLFGRFRAVSEFASGILQPVLYLENITDFDSGDMEFLIRPEIMYDVSLSRPVSGDRISLSETAGYYLRDGTDTERGMGITLKNKVSVPAGRFFTFRNRELYKLSLGDNDNSAELTYNDFYRSSSTTVFSSPERFYSSYLISNNSVSWRIGSLFPTVGEMFILDQSELYIFSDILLTQSVSYSCGLGFRLTASLIGLKPWNIDFILGRDIDKSEYFFSINVE